MNSYRINYSIGGNEVESTEFIERSEATARKMFKAFSKAGTITSIELTRENVCATKQQERDTLATIRRMVEELGPQSYLATAFAGCFEDAESNIENDFGESMKDRYESEQEKSAKLDDKIRLLQDTISRLQREAEQQETRIDELEAEAEKLKARREELLTDSKLGIQRITEQNAKIGEAQLQAEAAEAEVIHLKAKLYDYITAGA